ncbi:MAG: hypothetical protein VW881_08130, partial [Alphaproteobacteria bacterium]
MRDAVRASLRETPDMERALSRLTLGRGGPRDLAGIRDGLAAGRDLRARLAGSNPPEEIAAAIDDLGDQEALIDRLAHALADDLP